jgi:hypothetical protein
MSLFESVVAGRGQLSPTQVWDFWDLLPNEQKAEITRAVYQVGLWDDYTSQRPPPSLPPGASPASPAPISIQALDNLLWGVLASIRTNATANLPDNAKSAVQSQVFSLEDSLRALQASELAQMSAVDASKSATAASQVASSEATGQLWEHFNTYANEQTASGTRWRWITILILVGIAFAAIIYVIESPAAENWTEIVRKLLIAVPFFAVAGYAARQATEDLRAARWARETAVLLRTIGGYTAQLPQAEQNLVKTVFGTRLFLSDSGTSSSSDKISEDGNLSGVLSQLQSLTDSLQTLSRPGVSAQSSLPPLT